MSLSTLIEMLVDQSEKHTPLAARSASDRQTEQFDLIGNSMTMAHFFGTPSPAFSSRRDFLRRAGGGFGMLALAGLLGREGLLSPEASASELNALNPLAPKQPHF